MFFHMQQQEDHLVLGIDLQIFRNMSVNRVILILHLMFPHPLLILFGWVVLLLVQVVLWLNMLIILQMFN